MNLDDDVRDFLAEYNYLFEWEETLFGHINGDMWETILPNNAGRYVVRRMYGQAVQGVFIPDETHIPADSSRLINFWIQGADSFTKDPEAGWIKQDEAEHLARLWCEDHAVANFFVKRPKTEKAPAVDADELARSLQVLIDAGIISADALNNEQ